MENLYLNLKFASKGNKRITCLQSLSIDLNSKAGHFFPKKILNFQPIITVINTQNACHPMIKRVNQGKKKFLHYKKDKA